ncbi:helix-turn-helix domain-containing protein [Natronomonas halophila]|uniref:winged helix-turn-helix transcriptional regulator n=1 Tax=Natronomonas halophila TaxID=2747817 RepID=UPI0015B4BBC8|nr:helix-turn-helix domain-containing protein [Natronomonas halophila]QLD85796.1 helix-turn-helix domain-containing protein [Natronomonas halophila]
MVSGTLYRRGICVAACVALAFLLAAAVPAPAAADHDTTSDRFDDNRTDDWGDHDYRETNATDAVSDRSILDRNTTHVDLVNGTVGNATVARALAEDLDGVSASDLMSDNGTVHERALQNLTAEEAEALANHSALSVNASVLLEFETDPQRAEERALDDSGDGAGSTPEETGNDADSTVGVVLDADIVPADRRMGLNARVLPGVAVPMTASSLGADPVAVNRTESTTANDASSSTGGTATRSGGSDETATQGAGSGETAETPTPDDSSEAADGTNATAGVFDAPTTLDGVLDSGAPLAPASLFAMGLLTVVTRPWVGFLSTGAVLFGDWLGRFGVLFRFGRSSSTDPLEHETRTLIHDHLQEVPGESLTELSETLDVPLSTLRHHLKVLEREGEIVSHKQRNRRRFYPLGAEHEALTAALAEDTSADIIETLRRRGSATVGEVVDAVDRSYSTVSYHLSRLAEDGLVVQRTEGRQTVSRLDSSVESHLGPTSEPESTEFSGRNGEATAD